MTKSAFETMDFTGLALKCTEIQDDNGGILVSTTGSTNTVRSTAQFDAVTGTTGTTLTNITGLSKTVLAGATYRFRVHLAGTATTNCGIKVGFKYTTATLTSIESTATGMTASAQATQHSTTTTDQASLFASTTAVIKTTIEGTFVVNAAGTIQVQAAQNAAHADTTSVYVGSTFELVRIA